MDKTRLISISMMLKHLSDEIHESVLDTGSGETTQAAQIPDSHHTECHYLNTCEGECWDQDRSAKPYGMEVPLEPVGFNRITMEQDRSAVTEGWTAKMQSEHDMKCSSDHDCLGHQEQDRAAPICRDCLHRWRGSKGLHLHCFPCLSMQKIRLKAANTDEG